MKKKKQVNIYKIDRYVLIIIDYTFSLIKTILLCCSSVFMFLVKFYRTCIHITYMTFFFYFEIVYEVINSHAV